MLSKAIVVHFDVIYQSDIDHISYEIYLVVLEKNKVGVIRRYVTVNNVKKAS